MSLRNLASLVKCRKNSKAAGNSALLSIEGPSTLIGQLVFGGKVEEGDSGKGKGDGNKGKGTAATRRGRRHYRHSLIYLFMYILKCSLRYGSVVWWRSHFPYWRFRFRIRQPCDVAMLHCLRFLCYSFWFNIKEDHMLHNRFP